MFTAGSLQQGGKHSSKEVGIMAEINNARTGAAYLAARLEILRKEPEHGVINRNCVEMNSDLGLLWMNLSLWVGEREIFSQNIMVHCLDVDQLAQDLQRLKQGDCRIRKVTHYGVENSICFGLTSPELLLTIRQAVIMQDPHLVQRYLNGENITEELEVEGNEMDPIYEMWIGVDTGIAAGASHVKGDGPMLYFQPTYSQLDQFIKDFHTEKEVALLLEV